MPELYPAEAIVQVETLIIATSLLNTVRRDQAFLVEGRRHRLIRPALNIFAESGQVIRSGCNEMAERGVWDSLERGKVLKAVVVAAGISGWL